MSNGIGPSHHFRNTEELARHLGLSRWTVSRALNGHPGVSPATREKIERLVQARRFRPSWIAATLRSGQAPILGAIIPHLEGYRLGDKLARLQTAAQALGLRLVVEMAGGEPGREAEALENLSALRPAGLIQFASTLPPKHRARDGFAAAVPVVQIDPLCSGHSLAVFSDRARATELAVDHLVECGCRALWLFGIDPKTPYGRARWAGVRRGLKRHRLAATTQVLSLGARATDSAPDGEVYVRKAIDGLRRSRRVPVGILAMNDWIALGALRALLREGFRPGVDVRVIGYDAAEFTAHTTPSLSTVDPGSGALIDTAISFLETARKSGLTPQKAPRITPRLVARESTLGPNPPMHPIP